MEEGQEQEQGRGQEQGQGQGQGQEEPPTLGDVRSLAVFLTVCHHFLNYGKNV